MVSGVTWVLSRSNTDDKDTGIIVKIRDFSQDLIYYFIPMGPKATVTLVILCHHTTQEF